MVSEINLLRLLPHLPELNLSMDQIRPSSLTPDERHKAAMS